MNAALCPFVVGGDRWILEVDVDEADMDCRSGFLKLGIGRALNNRGSLVTTGGAGRVATRVIRRFGRVAVTRGAVCLGRGRARNWCVTGGFAGDVVRRVLGAVVTSGCWDRLEVRSSNGFGMVTLRGLATTGWDDGGGGCGGWMD